MHRRSLESEAIRLIQSPAATHVHPSDGAMPALPMPLVHSVLQPPVDSQFVAEVRGRVVASVDVHQDSSVAEVRSVRVEPECSDRTSLVARLMSAVLDHCRRSGVLKLIIDSWLAEQLRPLLADCGFQGTRRSPGTGRIECYLNLYHPANFADEHVAPRDESFLRKWLGPQQT